MGKGNLLCTPSKPCLPCISDGCHYYVADNSSLTRYCSPVSDPYGEWKVWVHPGDKCPFEQQPGVVQALQEAWPTWGVVLLTAAGCVGGGLVGWLAYNYRTPLLRAWNWLTSPLKPLWDRLVARFRRPVAYNGVVRLLDGYVNLSESEDDDVEYIDPRVAPPAIEEVPELLALPEPPPMLAIEAAPAAQEPGLEAEAADAVPEAVPVAPKREIGTRVPRVTRSGRSSVPPQRFGEDAV